MKQNANKTLSVRGWRVNRDIKLIGKTVVITGANTGIGFIAAIDFVTRGAKVFLACRNPEKAEDARKRIIAETNCNEELVITRTLDLASFASIREFCKNFNETEQRLDILLNNAGVMGCPQGKTKDGFETQFGTNHLGHFLLTNLLLDKMKASQPSRIVNVSSIAHLRVRRTINWEDLNNEKTYTPYLSYAQSKLMNILFTRELAKRLKETGVTAYCLHPGIIKTDLWRHLFDGNQSKWRAVFRVLTIPMQRAVLISPEKGAQTSIYCCIAPELETESGKYYCKFAETETSRIGKSDVDAKKLWAISERLTCIVTTDD